MEEAKLFYADKIPFDIAEHLQFKKILHTGYQPPIHKLIARNILDMIYDQLQGDTKKLVDGKTDTLVQDS